MRPIPFFVLLFGLAFVAFAPKAKTQQPTLAPCQCQSGGECTCEDCQCATPVQMVSVMKPEPVRNVAKAAVKAVAKAVDVLTPIDRVTVKQKQAISRAAQPSPQPSISAASPVNQGTWVYAGTQCNGGVCSPRYVWVVPAQAARVVQPAYQQPTYRFRGPVRRLFGR